MLRWIVLSVVLCMHTGCAPLSYTDVQRKRPSKQQQAWVRSSLGLAYLQQGQLLQAQDNMQQAMQLAPDDMQVQLAMLAFLDATQQWQKTQRLYQIVLEQHPGHAKLLHNYGTFLCQQGDIERAKFYFEAALQQQHSAQTYENMARCAAKNDRLDEAVAHLRHLVRIAPAKASILLEFGHWFMEHEQAVYVPSLIELYQSVAASNADFLWLQLKFSALQGDAAQVTKFGEQLVMLYPFSQPTKRYQAHEY